MLEVRLLGQFDLKLDGTPIPIASRAAQALCAYLLLHPNTAHRREKLAGLLWPDATEANARNNLRQALHRLRRALATGPQPYLLADDLTVTFDTRVECWLDVAVLEQKPVRETADDLLMVVSAYAGELLPGFYDEWVMLERERLQTVFERRMRQLLDKLVETRRWPEVLEWGG
jgi:DNA-binding SARP family transcriptional activator